MVPQSYRWYSPFCSRFQSYSARSVLGGRVAHVGAFSAPCWSPLVTFPFNAQLMVHQILPRGTRMSRKHQQTTAHTWLSFMMIFIDFSIHTSGCSFSCVSDAFPVRALMMWNPQKRWPSHYFSVFWYFRKAWFGHEIDMVFHLGFHSILLCFWTPLGHRCWFMFVICSRHWFVNELFAFRL